MTNSLVNPKRCATCKWWKKEFLFLRDGTCEMVEYSYTKLAWVTVDVDGEDWATGHLKTREDFGCVLHEEKEEHV